MMVSQPVLELYFWLLDNMGTCGNLKRLYRLLFVGSGALRQDLKSLYCLLFYTLIGFCKKVPEPNLIMHLASDPSIIKA